MNRSSVRFRQAAPPEAPGQRPSSTPGVFFILSTKCLRCPRGAPEFRGRVPQVLVDQVAVEIHGHRRGGVPQDPLYHLGTRAGAQPQRGGCVPQVVHPECRPADRLGGRAPADRALPSSPPPADLLAEPRTASLRPACPRPRRRPAAPVRPPEAPLALERVNEQFAALAASQHGALQPQPLTRGRDAVPDLEATDGRSHRSVTAVSVELPNRVGAALAHEPRWDLAMALLRRRHVRAATSPRAPWR